jgi:hypothetical protein
MLGATADPQWDFDVSELYVGMATVDSASLVAPFTPTEALAAVKAMNSTSAPVLTALGLASTAQPGSLSGQRS